MRKGIPIVILMLGLVATFARAAEPTSDSPPAPAASPPPASAPGSTSAGIVKVVMQTALGDIELALEQGKAPITVGNFLRYVDAKRFDGIEFYRAVRIGDQGDYGLVQGGLQADPKRLFKPILHETTYATGLSHTNGAISMARGEPGSATADFFIVVGDLVALDGQPTGDPGYAVFGRVTQGMEIVRSMLDLPRSAEAKQEAMKGQMLAQPVKVLSVRRID